MIDLKHCTFLIPTLIDTEDRVKNLFLIIKYLTTHFDTNIFIGEQNNLKCVAEELVTSHGLNHPSVKFFHVDYHLPYFHRSGIFNALAGETDTKCISIYDTDVLLKPEQYYMACKQIMEDRFDMIYPYDGKFHGVPKHYRDMIYESLDLTQINLSECKIEHPDSVGGAVIYNREVFMKGGMENENFKGWGQEDNERYVRFNILGYRQCRVSGPLYHFNHEKVTSEFYIPNSDRDNYRRLMEIERLTKEQLQEQIKNWTWCNSVK
jgi:hypothetical protein